LPDKEENLNHREDTLILRVKAADDESRTKRTEWLREIGVVEIGSGILAQPSSRIEVHAREAEVSLVNGCCISSIFNSATAVQEAFKHVMIRDSPDRWTTLRRLRSRRHTFGKIIDEARKLPTLKSFIPDAEWLNKIRNGLSAHPLYVDLGKARTSHDLEWEAIIATEDLENMLSFLPTAARKCVYSSKIGKRTFGEAIYARDRHEVQFLWHYFRASVLPVLAELALLKMLGILSALGFHFQRRYRFWWESPSERRRRALAIPSPVPGAQIHIVGAAA
jgi:hypothetical protein